MRPDADKLCRDADKLCRNADKLCRDADKLCRDADKCADKLCRDADKGTGPKPRPFASNSSRYAGDCSVMISRG